MKRLLLHLLATLAVAVMALPLLLMLMNSLKGATEAQQGFMALPREPSFAAWQEAWARLSGSFAVSLMLAIPAVLLSAGLAALNGFVLCKYRFRGERWVGLLLVLAFFLPIKV
ncbi:MAG TPA: hypothetical protein VGF12_16465, partial [Roseateles sp.]